MNRFFEWLLNLKPGELTGANWSFRFVAQYNPYVSLLLLCVGAGMVYLTVRSYRREGDAPRKAKVVLATIRIVVIALALAILFRPAVVMQFARTLHSSVVVLIDDSLSMSFKDGYSERKDLQEGLSKTLGVGREEIGRLSRSELLRRALTRNDGTMDRLAKDHPLVLMRFSTTQPGTEPYTRPLGKPTTVDEKRESSNAGNQALAELAEALNRLKANGYETDIPTAMRDALEAVQGRRTTAIIIISDGQITSADARDRLRSAQEYAAQRGVPLYTVAVGDPTEARNVAVATLRAPHEVRRDSKVDFTVILSHRNMENRAVTVRLLRRPADGKGKEEIVTSESVTLKAPKTQTEGKGLQEVTLSTRPDKTGRYVYRVVAESAVDEPNKADNYAEAVVTVAEAQINVLLVGGDAGWEFQRLRDFLYTHKHTYRLSVWQQNADPEVSQTASTGMRLKHLPRDEVGLMGDKDDKKNKPGYDVVILYDPEPTKNGFDATFVQNLKKFVDLGGGLCYIAGNKNTDILLPRGRTSPFKPLVDLLPVRLSPNKVDIATRIGKTKPEPWPIRLTTYGEDHPIMKLGGSVEETQYIYQILPGLFWSHPVESVKPSARVLAVSSDPLRRTERNSPEPLVAVQPYGMGRVLYMGFDATWRWRAVDDGNFFRRYWNNVFSYLGGLKTRRIVITTGGDRFSLGERIRLEVEALTKDYKLLKDETFDVEMVNIKTGESETITLKKAPGRDGRYRKTIRAVHTGRFELTALKNDPKASEKVSSKRIIIELPQAEALRREADFKTSEQIASRPDNFMTLGEMDKLTRLIRPERLTARHEVPRELWDSLTMLLVIVALLAIELILRKKYNMA